MPTKTKTSRLPRPPVSPPDAPSTVGADLGSLLNPEDVARQLGVTKETILGWARVGQARGDAIVILPSFRFGRQIRFRNTDVMTFGQQLGALGAPRRTRAS